MATIKAIESRSVHQIQSGQVIVDLSSVVKELVENSLDAGATSIEIRFKNHGADSIEVQDNGNGIAPEDFETVALKHYTSKLSSYDDLDSLDTFGFRGEALSSLCALSKFHILTARAQDGAVGKRLDFEVSGKLKGTSVAAAQKGTTIFVENLFHNLPVRRKELEKNVKREYAKVITYLNQYACISIGVRFTVSNIVLKGKKTTVFQTKANTSTRENISNIFGVKALASLVELDLSFQLEASGSTFQHARLHSEETSESSRSVRIEGHISKPVFGEGRQTQDRQMYFVNSRPCLLPQIAKAINEVYRSFNVSQTPFVFANLIMDTSSYDVNVSPDKRTILLHDQTALLESLKNALTDLFERSEQTVPQASLRTDTISTPRLAMTVQRLPFTASRPPAQSSYVGSLLSEANDERAYASVQREASSESLAGPSSPRAVRGADDTAALEETPLRSRPHRIDDGPNCIQNRSSDEIAHEDNNSERHVQISAIGPAPGRDVLQNRTDATDSRDKSSLFVSELSDDELDDQTSPVHARSSDEKLDLYGSSDIARHFTSSQANSPGPIQKAFAHMRPKRPPTQIAEITIGDQKTTAILGEANAYKKRRMDDLPSLSSNGSFQSSPLLAQLRRKFAAPGSQLAESETPPIPAQRTPKHGGSSSPECSDDESERATAESMPESVSDDESEDEEADQVSSHAAAFDQDQNDSESGSSAQDDSTVAQDTRDVDHADAGSTRDMLKRASQLMKNNSRRKDNTLNLAYYATLSVDAIKDEMKCFGRADLDQNLPIGVTGAPIVREDIETAEAENLLSLTVTKADFGTMRVIGQFNLGFILAVRPSQSEGGEDDLFIIDQHAADEKYNYERLQHSVVLHSQRLARPKVLELTAYEQEVVLNHDEALKANGFEIESTYSQIGDETDEVALARSFQLLTLPTSHQTTFALSDLEELIHLLSEEGSSSSGKRIPRPTKVQKMLAMRACRSSIMVGKTLTNKQMTQVARNMGEMEKPWNCPHGRPTMRHLARLGGWTGWREGDSMDDDDEVIDEGYALEEALSHSQITPATRWQKWLDDLQGDAD